MKEALLTLGSWAWTAWSYGFVFVAILALEMWLAAQFEPKEGYNLPHRWVAPVLFVSMVAIAAACSYLANQRPYLSDCATHNDSC